MVQTTSLSRLAHLDVHHPTLTNAIKIPLRVARPIHSCKHSAPAAPNTLINEEIAQRDIAPDTETSIETQQETPIATRETAQQTIREEEEEPETEPPIRKVYEQVQTQTSETPNISEASHTTGKRSREESLKSTSKVEENERVDIVGSPISVEESKEISPEEMENPSNDTKMIENMDVRIQTPKEETLNIRAATSPLEEQRTADVFEIKQADELNSTPVKPYQRFVNERQYVKAKLLELSSVLPPTIHP